MQSQTANRHARGKRRVQIRRRPAFHADPPIRETNAERDGGSRRRKGGVGRDSRANSGNAAGAKQTRDAARDQDANHPEVRPSRSSGAARERPRHAFTFSSMVPVLMCCIRAAVRRQQALKWVTARRKKEEQTRGRQVRRTRWRGDAAAHARIWHRGCRRRVAEGMEEDSGEHVRRAGECIDNGGRWCCIVECRHSRQLHQRRQHARAVKVRARASVPTDPPHGPDPSFTVQ